MVTYIAEDYSDGHWNNKENRRELMEKFARDNKFDALIPENWYSTPKHTIMRYKKKVKNITLIC